MDAEKFFTHSLRNNPRGKEVVQILASAIEAVDPYKAVYSQLFLVGHLLHLGPATYNLKNYRRVFVVGAGKAGLPMAEAVVDKLGSWLTDGLVIVKEGYGGKPKIGPIKIEEASHPLPDRRGVEATVRVLSLLEDARVDDLVLVLISGGGSALLTSPAQGVSLEDMRELTQLLLASGGDITEINTLRKRLDLVKAGGLARAAAPAHVAALILSDVVGDPLDKIASGPTVFEISRRKEALEILTRYDLTEKVPASILRVLRQLPPMPPPAAPAKPNNILVGNNEIAARAALEKAKSFGFQTELLTTTLQGEAWQVGLEMAEKLKAIQSKTRPGLWLAGGETTVTLQGQGLGGRNQELALAAVSTLDGVPEVALISLATDGGDGPTEAAGAVVTGESFSRAAEKSLAPEDYLANNDSYTFFSALEDCLVPGPTRTNVNDLLFLFAF